MTAESDYQYNWAFLTEPVLIHIFQYLEARAVLNAGAMQKNWNAIRYDELVRQHKLRKDFNSNTSINIKPSTDRIEFDLIAFPGQLYSVKNSFLSKMKFGIKNINVLTVDLLYFACIKRNF